MILWDQARIESRPIKLNKAEPILSLSEKSLWYKISMYLA